MIFIIDIYTRYVYQRGNGSKYLSSNYNSDFNIIDQYILAKVQMKNGGMDRIILDPAAYNALVDQVARDIEKAVEQVFNG